MSSNIETPFVPYELTVERIRKYQQISVKQKLTWLEDIHKYAHLPLGKRQEIFHKWVEDYELPD